MVDFIIGLEFLALWHPKYTINGGHFYLGNEDKTKGVIGVLWAKWYFKTAEKHIEVLEEIVKEKENLLVTMKDDSVAIMDLI